MKILQPKYLVVSIVLLFLACESKGQQALEACGEIKTLTIDAEYAQMAGLPEINFELEYPAEMEFTPALEGQKNYNYATFVSRDSLGNRKEMISIGYYTMEGTDEATMDALNEDLLSQFRQMYVANFELSNEFLGKKEFDGKEYPMFQTIGKIDRPEAEFVGSYIVQAMLIRPNPASNSGVVFIFQSNENSAITSFEDIGKKGCSSIIWNSLKFND
ncbi:MAG: hypothetical protein JJ978_12800 [Roseivirga sp.]|jgi:hypothetical protein|uniref:hypothetical protein n=1 Tax=Roseivirga sp. TaxID=1964215 RepID=UPI001B08AB2D|nr:hypothetical protein [Roseivirga sp.]MBO6496442.1 hypothetical protein [Roseivirga sp.]